MTFDFSCVSWSFYQKEVDEIINELLETLREFNTDNIVVHYKIKNISPLDEFNFHDKMKFREFMADFASFANFQWKVETRCDWDFSKVPFRMSSEKIEGLIKIFQTGGAYSQGVGKKRALELEESIRHQFQQNSDNLYIFNIAKYDLDEGVGTKSFSVDMNTYDSLKGISKWFALIAWDDLMFIINPKSSDFYVIAITDED